MIAPPALASTLSQKADMVWLAWLLSRRKLFHGKWLRCALPAGTGVAKWQRRGD